MAAASLGPILRHIHEMTGSGSADDWSDAELVKRIVHRQDQEAFAHVVRRHSALVWRVCRRVLHDSDGAEDAFQSTFLVFAQQARSIRNPATLSSWLHGVALRIALRAKLTRPCRGGPTGLELATLPGDDPGLQAACKELGRIVEEEVAKLPERLRLPVLLCYWHCKSNEEAAQELGWPIGTVKARLTKAREVLHRRLVQRGVSLSAGALALLLAPATTTAVPPLLLAATAKIGLGHGAPLAVSAVVRTLAETALPGSALLKLKMAALFLAAVCLTMVTAVGITSTPEEKQPAQANVEPNSKPAAQIVPANEQKPAQPNRDDMALPPGAIARLGTQAFRHDGRLQSLAFNRAGDTLAGMTRAGVVFWDVASGKERWRINEQGGHIDLSADGKTLVIQRFHELSLWDLVARKNIKTFKFQELLPDLFEKDMRVRISPDGKSLAFSAGIKAAVVDLESGKLRGTFGVSRATMSDLAFSPSGKLLAVATLGPSVQIWDIATGKLAHGMDDHDNKFAYAVAFSQDGKRLASASWDRIVLSDPETGKPLSRLEAKMQSVQDLTFTPDGKELLSSSQDGKIRVWDVETGKVRLTLDGADGRRGMALARDGKTVACSAESAVRLWNVQTGKELGVPGHRSPVDVLVFSPDGATLYSGGWQLPIRAWSTATWEQTRTFDGGAPPLALSPDGKRLVTAPSNNVVSIWDTASSQEILRITTPHYVRHGFFFPGGKNLLVYDQEIDQDTSKYLNHLRVWDSVTGKMLKEFAYRGFFLFHVVPTSTGKVVGCDYQGIKQFDLERKRIDWHINQGKATLHLALAPDEATFVSGGHKAAQLWELMSGQQIHSFKGHQRTPGAVAVSPDGRVVASGDRFDFSDDVADVPASIILWDVVNGQQLAKFTIPGANIRSMAFAPDGRHVVTGLQDSTILIWDVAKFRNLPPPGPPQLTNQELAKLWDDLLGDAGPAHRAVWSLASAPADAVPFLQKRLQPAAAIDAKSVQKLIDGLDSEKLAIREAATQDLRKLGSQARQSMERALRDSPTLEAARRLDLILSLIPVVPPPETLRSMRSMRILEMIGNAASRDLLKTLATGAPDAHETRLARTAIERLERRSK